MVAIIIIPASLKPLAEQCVATLSPLSVGESLMIPLGLSPDGPVTHWASLPITSEEVAQQLELLARSPDFAGASVSLCEVDTVPATFAVTLAERGLIRLTIKDQE